MTGEMPDHMVDPELLELTNKVLGTWPNISNKERAYIQHILYEIKHQNRRVFGYHYPSK